MRLYDIANDYIALMNAIENDEIPEDAVNDTLEAIQGELEEKADNIGCLLKELEAATYAIKAEEQRLAERRKKKEKLYDRLKNYLSDSLLGMGINKLETTRNAITFRKSEVAEVNEAAFMEWAKVNRADLITVKVTESANKTEIKKALKSGEEIPGAVLVTKNNLQLK